MKKFICYLFIVVFFGSNCSFAKPNNTSNNYSADLNGSWVGKCDNHSSLELTIKQTKNFVLLTGGVHQYGPHMYYLNGVATEKNNHNSNFTVITNSTANWNKDSSITLNGSILDSQQINEGNSRIAFRINTVNIKVIDDHMEYKYIGFSKQDTDKDFFKINTRCSLVRKNT